MRAGLAKMSQIMAYGEIVDILSRQGLIDGGTSRLEPGQRAGTMVA